MARAQCVGDHPRWIGLSFEGDGWSSAVASRTLAQLESGLGTIGFDACSGDARPGDPVARIALVATGTTLSRVSLVVNDRVTAKTVSRTIDLARYTSAEQPLVLAVATEELVRSSWAELAYVQPPTPAAAPAPPPPEIARAVQERLPPPATHRGIGVVATGGADVVATRQFYVGGDVRLRLSPTDAFAFVVGLGARDALSLVLPQGTLHAQWYFGDAGVSVRLARPAGVRLDAEGEARVGFASVDGSAAASGVIARNGVAPTVVATLGLSLRAPAEGPIAFVIHASVGDSLLAVRAVGPGDSKGGVYGLLLGAALGLEWGGP